MTDAVPANYPAEWEAHAVLADGAPVEIRPILPADRALLDAFHRRQSTESIYFRFFRPRPELSDQELSYFTEVDYDRRMAFVALLGGELVAVARYEGANGATRPEVAFFVDDAHHGRGLATLLLEYLAAMARSRQLDGFTATVLPENYAMLGVFRRAGFDVRTRFDDGLIEVEIGISVTDEASSAIADRHRRARSASVGRLLSPGSVAVVGASRQPGSVGHELLRHVLRGEFTGAVHAVNPAADDVLGVRCVPSLRHIDEPLDLAIVAVPADAVEAVVADAVAAKVSGLLIVSSGFAETGPQGAELEAAIVTAARSNGMRIIGPNAFGMVNTDPAVNLRSLFLPLRTIPGSVALMSQSGPLGSAVLEHMWSSGVGISSFVAAGNRADVSVNDLLEYWADDEHTNCVLLYVENYGNLRTFAGIAQATSARKPVVTVRPPDQNLVELLEQSGVILVESVIGLADMARVASAQPLPRGRRVAVVANAASVARLTAAACRRYGLEPVVPSSIRQPLEGPGSAAETVLIGDVDTIAVAGAGGRPDYEQILVAAAVSAEADLVLIALVPTLDLTIDELSALLRRVNRSVDKPVVVAGMIDTVDRRPAPDGTAPDGTAPNDPAPDDQLGGSDLPVYTFPEEAARALGRLADYADWRRQRAPVETAEPSEGEEHQPVDGALGDLLGGLVDGGEPVELSLWSASAAELVGHLGLPVAPWRVGNDYEELAAAAEELGYPVVLKTGGERRRAVGESAGTAIDLHGPGQLRDAYDRMLATRGSAMLPAVVQRMLQVRAHVRVDVVQDPDLGAFARIGLGGAAGASVAPASRRFLPLMAGEAAAMVGALAATVTVEPEESKLLVAVLERLAGAAMAIPELAQVTLDPILLAGADSAISDFRVEVLPWQHDPLAGVRRL